MLLKTTIFTLFTIYCAAVFASKYSITITSERPDSHADSTDTLSEENITPRDNKINSESVRIQLNDEPESTDILEQIFKANALQFGDKLGSPVFVNAERTNTDSDLIKGLFPESLGRMDDPTDFLDVIMKDGRFADVRHILKDIIEDIDEDEYDYDYEEDDNNGYDIEDEDEDEDEEYFEEDEEDDAYYVMANQLMNKRKKIVTDGIPSTITSSMETQNNNHVTSTSFISNTYIVSKENLHNTTQFKTTCLSFPKSHTITTHFPSRLFVVTSKNTETQTKENNTILKVERNLGTNQEFYTFMKSIYLFTLIFLLILLYFDQ